MIWARDWTLFPTRNRLARLVTACKSIDVSGMAHIIRRGARNNAYARTLCSTRPVWIVSHFWIANNYMEKT